MGGGGGGGSHAQCLCCVCPGVTRAQASGCFGLDKRSETPSDWHPIRNVHSLCLCRWACGPWARCLRCGCVEQLAGRVQTETTRVGAGRGSPWESRACPLPAWKQRVGGRNGSPQGSRQGALMKGGARRRVLSSALAGWGGGGLGRAQRPARSSAAPCSAVLGDPFPCRMNCRRLVQQGPRPRRGLARGLPLSQSPAAPPCPAPSQPLLNPAEGKRLQLQVEGPAFASVAPRKAGGQRESPRLAARPSWLAGCQLPQGAFRTPRLWSDAPLPLSASDRVNS